jgi:hypothetical protein
VFLIVAAGLLLALVGEFLGIVSNSAPEDLAVRYTSVGVTGHDVPALSDSSSAGAHSATRDTRNVPADVYFLRLTAQSGQRSLKTVVGR